MYNVIVNRDIIYMCVLTALIHVFSTICLDINMDLCMLTSLDHEYCRYGEWREHFRLISLRVTKLILSRAQQRPSLLKEAILLNISISHVKPPIGVS